MVEKNPLLANTGLSSPMDRREAIERSLRFGGGLVLLGLLPASLSGCAVEEGLVAEGPAQNGLAGMTLTPAPEAEIALAPYRIGDLLDKQYKLIAVERAQDNHLRVRLFDVEHGGRMEIELFHRGETTRPVAATDRWEFYTYNAAQGDAETPSHVKDVISHLATNIAEIEHGADMVALSETVCRFGERTF